MTRVGPRMEPIWRGGREGGREEGYVGAHGTEGVEGRDADGMSPNNEGGANPKGREGRKIASTRS